MKIKRKEKLSKAKEARRLARKIGAKPAATRVIPDKRWKPEKHRQDLAREVESL